MTPQSKERPVKVRKPLAIVRELQSDVDWLLKFGVDAPRTLRAMRDDLRELRRSLAQQPPQGRSARRGGR